MEYVTFKRLKVLFDASYDTLNIALCATPFVCESGRNKYDVTLAGRALSAYYRRKADNNMIQHQRRVKMESTFYAEKAMDYERKACAVDEKVARLLAE